MKKVVKVKRSFRHDLEKAIALGIQKHLMSIETAATHINDTDSIQIINMKDGLSICISYGIYK